MEKMPNNLVNDSDGDVADVKFCKNCKKSIAASNFTVHELHCVRNITLCPRCGEPVAKNDLERHVADQHTTVTCPECGENISANLLEDHQRSVHSTTACPLCHKVVDNSDLHQHQVAECSRRQVSCQFCNMMLAYTELRDHEDYCGSRTEPCVRCDRYIMVRDAAIHQQTNCEYPYVEPKNETDTSAMDAEPGFRWIDDPSSAFNPRGMLFPDLHQHLHDMVENRQHDHLERMLGRMQLPGTRSSPEDPFLERRFRPFNDKPPPYFCDDGANDVHGDKRHQSVEEHDRPGDRAVVISSDDDHDYDDDDITLPCEFCKKLYVASKLLQHQTVCQLTYVENDAGDDAAARSPQHSEELRATSEQERADRDTSNTDAIGSSPVPAIIDDSLSSVDVEQYLPTDSLDIDGNNEPVVPEAVAADSPQQSLIPCEFCLELFDEHTVEEHQDDCIRQQTSAMQALLETTDATRLYRFPYSAMSLEDRERLGQ